MNEIYEWIKEHIGIIVMNVLFDVCLLLWYLFVDTDREYFVIYFLVGSMIFGITLFIRLFTLDIPDNLAQLSSFLRPLFVYSYAFMFFAIGTAIVPFFITFNWTELEKRPITLILGCSESTDAPAELKCINIKLNAALPAKQVENLAEKANQETVSTIETAVAAIARVEGQAKNVEEAKGLKLQSKQWLVNIGGGTKCNYDLSPNECVVYGGLVVPLYFIVLALLGGAISLTRRIPEYQKQVSENYKSTPENPKLTPYEVREALAFQIVQFVSAPLIAVVAYYIIEPASSSGVVALGFIAGFSSEAILKLIRELVNKMAPSNIEYQEDILQEISLPKGRITGKVTNSKDKSLANIEVTASKDDEIVITKKTAEDGVFNFTEVPVGEVVVKATKDEQKSEITLNVEQGIETACPPIKLG